MKRVTDIMSEDDKQRMVEIIDECEDELSSMNPEYHYQEHSHTESSQQLSHILAKRILEVESNYKYLKGDRDRLREKYKDARDVVREGRRNQMHYLEDLLSELTDEKDENHELRDRLNIAESKNR